MNEITTIIEDKKELLNRLVETKYLEKVENVANVISSELSNNRKLIIAGNGGSAADAQHFAAEMIGRFLKERNPIPAISLCVDPSVMTSISNDYGFDSCFERQINGLGNKGDIFVAISTSGNSINLLKAVKAAKERGMHTVALTGGTGGELANFCEYALIVPSNVTPRIQETHIFTVHFLCEMIENKLTKDTGNDER